MLTKERRITKPCIVGYWAVQVTPQMDLIKWGKDGGTKFPHKRPSDAVAQLRHLQEQEPRSRYYLLRLFDNGQMRTFEYE